MSMLKLQDPIDRFGDEIPEATPRQVEVTSVRISTWEMVNLILTFTWALFLISLVPVVAVLLLAILFRTASGNGP